MWYLAIVMAISIIFSFALYNVTTGELDRGLHRESERIELQFPVFNDDPQLNQMGPDADEDARSILLRLISLNLFVLVAAGFASYWLARRTLEPIEAAHEQQKRFTADVSHELRTPLTVLRMESEVALLQKKNSATDLRKILRSNLEEVSKIDSLINNLLRLTLLEAEELHQHFQPVNSNEVIDEAISQVQKLADERRITIDKQLSDTKILGDRDSLVQIAVILLDNAIKYSAAKTTISIKTTRHKQEVIWHITDQGKGIEREDLEHIFDRFYRADSSRAKSDTTGYGLGLSIAKMIADIHDGTITIKSRVGNGTTAIVSLPTSEVKAQE
jgi:signal transduction histidine kinase